MANVIIAAITITFLTFFMRLEGRRGSSCSRHRSRALPPNADAVGDDIYRALSGYVTGNLVISVIAGCGVR